MSAPTTVERPGPDHVTDEDGKRFYPIDGKNFWSVTTALTALSKDGLPPWAAGLAARAAFDDLPKILTASRTKPCGNTYSQCRRSNGGHDWRIRCTTCPCTQCQACMTRWLADRHITTRDRRADEGKRTHRWIDNWVINDGEHAPLADDIAPFVRSFLAFTKAYGLTPDSWLFSEAIVINRAEEYAGTTDGGIRFVARATDAACDVVAMLHQQPKSVCVDDDLFADVIADFKTKDDPPDKAVKFYPDVALQLAAYRHAPMVHIRRLGLEEPMPGTHGGMAVRLYPDRVVPRLCVTDEMTHAAFLNVLSLYRWRIECGAASVSTRSFKVPPEPKSAAAPRKAAAKRTPAKKAAPRKSIAKDPDALIPDADAAPRPLKAVAAAQSATLASMRRVTPDPKPVHPNSPLQDHIPF